MTGFLKRVELYLGKSHKQDHRSQRNGNEYNKHPALHPISPARESYPTSKRGQAKRLAPPTGYDAALIAVRWIVLVALFKVPVTSTFCPANGAGFFWSLSW